MNSINIAEMFELVHENWNVTIEMKVVEQWFEPRSAPFFFSQKERVCFLWRCPSFLLLFLRRSDVF